MSDWPGYDPAAPRASEIAAAAAVVRRFRRRRRHTLTAAGSTLAAAAVLSSALLGGSGMSSLEPVDTPSSDPAFTWVSPSPNASPTPAGSPSPASGTALTEAGGSVVAGPPALSTSPPIASDYQPHRRPMVRTAGSTGPAGLDCLPYKLGEALCATSSAVVQRDGSVRFRYIACQRTGSPTVTLDFTGEVEVDFTVHRDGHLVWRWSTGQRFRQLAHQLTIDGGRCFEWRTYWSGIRDDGTRATAGRYLAHAFGVDRDETMPRDQNEYFDLT